MSDIQRYLQVAIGYLELEMHNDMTCCPAFFSNWFCCSFGVTGRG